MKDKIFIDTNIWVYVALVDNKSIEKRKIAVKLIQGLDTYIVSTQVLNEFYSVLIKHNVSDKEILVYISEITANTFVGSQNIQTLEKAWFIKQKYLFSLWDSLIIASALQNNCTTLYTEDMQHNQLIENTLKIVNPFK